MYFSNGITTSTFKYLHYSVLPFLVEKKVNFPSIVLIFIHSKSKKELHIAQNVLYGHAEKLDHLFSFSKKSSMAVFHY